MGAVFALTMSMLESKYFAATAIHAGAWDSSQYSSIDDAKRKIPIAILVGDQDQYFSTLVVKATAERLKQRGFPVELTIVPFHDHWYYDIAPDINKLLWNFLKRHSLEEEPAYEPHSFKGQSKGESKTKSKPFIFILRHSCLANAATAGNAH